MGHNDIANAAKMRVVLEKHGGMPGKLLEGLKMQARREQQAIARAPISTAQRRKMHIEVKKDYREAQALRVRGNAIMHPMGRPGRPMGCNAKHLAQARALPKKQQQRAKLLKKFK